VRSRLKAQPSVGSASKGKKFLLTSSRGKALPRPKRRVHRKNIEGCNLSYLGDFLNIERKSELSRGNLDHEIRVQILTREWGSKVLKFRIKVGLAIVSRDRCRKGQNIWEIDFRKIFERKGKYSRSHEEWSQLRPLDLEGTHDIYP
jgi:hypothetical protein